VNYPALIDGFFAAGNRAAASDDVRELHTLRIAAKHLRYALEILEPDGAKPLLTALKQVQRTLGDMNDAFVAAAFLEGLSSLTPRARRLPSLLRNDGEGHIAAFHRLWPRTFSTRAQKRWLTWARAAGE
jgi:CHAD domain-containing protein